YEPACEAALCPLQVGPLVRRSVIRGPRACCIAPACKRGPPRRPLVRIVGRGDDLGLVEIAVDRRREVDRARDERIERHVRARVRATSSSSVTPSNDGSELANRPCSGSDQRSSIGPSAPKIEPTAAPFVSVSQPAWTTPQIADERSSNR